LQHNDPLIWRQVEVPTSIRLTVLHDIIQAVMGWCDYHLWEFNIDRRKYGLAMDEDWGGTPRSLGSHVRLRDVLKPGRTVIDYTYDFGDCWERRLTVTDVRAGQPGVSYPRYVGGERNGPPEDCGGISGFYEWLTALADPKHEGHALRAAEDLSTHSRSMKRSKLWQLWQKRPRRRSRLSTDLREAASVSSADQDGGRRRAVTDQLISVFD
jgi:hypothetical protein